MKPKVSIVIPVYNGGNYLREAIESAVAQTYDNIEIVVVNDGSTDDGATEEIAMSFGERIRYFRKENGGVASALNFGIRNMSGQYFSWLSHDDLYLPEKVEKQLAALQDYSADAAVAFCDYCCIDPNGEVLREAKVSPKSVLSIRCFLATDVKTGMHGCSLLIPRAVFDQVGCFDESLTTSQDYDLWFRIAGAGIPFVQVPAALVLSRQHPGQDSRNKLDTCRLEADRLHSRILSSLSESEVKPFADDSLHYFFEVYPVYRTAGYVRTAAAILRLLVRYAKTLEEKNGVAELLLRDIIQSGDKGDALYLLTGRLQPLLSFAKARPRVIIYNNVWRRGGLERVLADVISHLQQRFDVTLVTVDESDYEGFPVSQSVLRIHIKINDDYLDRLIGLAVLLEADVFIGNSNLISSFGDIYEKIKSVGIKTIACNHGNFFLPFTYTWLNSVIVEREKIFAHANVVTWLTNFAANVYGAMHSNGAYMPNPLRYSGADAPPRPAEKTEKIVLCVGRFYDSIKRLDRALAVFRKVLDKHPDARLHVVGGYDLQMHIPEEAPESVAEILDHLGLDSGQIVFWGEQEQVDSFYEKASLLIFTSDSEGFGVVLTEAGAFGLPAVIFDIPGLEDIISDGLNGFVLAQDDIAGMADKVSLLLEDQTLRQNMGDQARKLAERFAKEKILARWENLVLDVIDTQSQNDINHMLQHKYMETPTDREAVYHRALLEYDKNVRAMVKSFENPITNVSPAQIVDFKPRLALWCWKICYSISCNGWKVTGKKILQKVRTKLSAQR